MILFAVYGTFTEAPMSASKYKTSGIPKGVEVRKLTRQAQPNFPFTDGDFAKVLKNDNPSLFANILKAPECVILKGEVVDPPNLDYLRDCVGVITFYFEHGGVAVIDPQQIKAYDANTWRADFFNSGLPSVHRHVSILLSVDEKKRGRWYHTRGMRKFGRPDLSIPNVPPEYDSAVIDMCNRFIELQALGGRIREGQEIRMGSLPPGLIGRHKGTLEDPDFNNVHVEIDFRTNK